MKIFYADTFPIPLPEKHSFPKDKYFLLRMRILEELGDQPVDLRIPEPASDEDIIRAHDPEYLSRLQNSELSAKEIRCVGLPWSTVDIHFQTLLSAIDFKKSFDSRLK